MFWGAWWTPWRARVVAHGIWGPVLLDSVIMAVSRQVK